jgi:AcrR family transcriptional regulator
VPRPTRASALPPDERRAALVEAVVPLLLQHGAGVTTRQIAEAAGVAEGTLFRVFDDKQALLHAAAHALLDPERTRRELDATDRSLPLEQMVRTVAEQQIAAMSRTMQVLMALRSGPRPPGDRPGPPAFVLEAHRALLDGLTALFERHRDELRVEPARAALLLRALLFGCRQPESDDPHVLTGDEIATALLTGIRS